jgi:hypothetical protein
MGLGERSFAKFSAANDTVRRTSVFTIFLKPLTGMPFIKRAMGYNDGFEIFMAPERDYEINTTSFARE